MIKQLDRTLQNVANKLLVFCNFIGLSRRTAIVIWILFAHFIVVLPQSTTPVNTYGLFELCLLLTILVLISPITYLLLIFAMVTYRKFEKAANDNMLPANSFCSPTWRVVYIVWFLFCSYYQPSAGRIDINHAYTMIVLILKLCFPIFLWPYFLLNWKLPVRNSLKGLVKEKLTNLTEQFLPKPLPEPAPIKFNAQS